MPRPNVLWIMTDQHTYDALSCAGHPIVETPTIDRLAGDGVRFSDAYCPSPRCGPARAAVFTGRYPAATGASGNWEPFDDDVALLPQRFGAAGYHTARIGKLHLAPIAADHGFQYQRRHDNMNDCYDDNAPWVSDYVRWLADERFDGDVEAVIERANADERALSVDGDYRQFYLGSDWRTEAEHSNTWVTEQTREYLERDHPEPFFCFSSYFGPHQPMAAPGEWRDRYDPADVPKPEEFDVGVADKPIASRGGPANWEWADYAEVLAAYYGQISMIDDGIGAILDTLEEQGLREDTVVIFTADHGEHAGQFGQFSKGTMYANSVRVPLVVADPNGASGASCERVVNTIDLFETLHDRCGLDGGATETPSRSLTPLVSDPTADWTDRTYAQLQNHWMVVDGDHKCYRVVDGTWDRTGEDRRRHELYDRTRRPHDGENRFGLAETADVQGRMIELLDGFQANPDGVV